MNTGKSAKGNLVIRILIHLAAVMAICALMVVGVKYLLVRAPVNSFEFQPCGRTPQVDYLLC